MSCCRFEGAVHQKCTAERQTEYAQEPEQMQENDPGETTWVALPCLALPRKRICSVHDGSRGAVCHASFGFDAVRRFRRVVV